MAIVAGRGIRVAGPVDERCQVVRLFPPRRQLKLLQRAHHAAGPAVDERHHRHRDNAPRAYADPHAYARAADAALQARWREQLDAWCDREGVEAVTARLGVGLHVLGKMLVGRRRIPLKVVRVLDERGFLGQVRGISAKVGYREESEAA